MLFLPPDTDVVPYQEGFKDDLLGRKRVGVSLSSLVERIDDPIVIALDGRWGTGKTHFLKRWVGAHKLENGGKATTVYFDAFANDYLDDPLIALVGALSDRIPAAQKPKMEKLKKFALKLIKPAARVGLAVGSYGATEALPALADAVVEATTSQLDKALDSFWKQEEGRRAAMGQFHAAINALVGNPGEEDFTPVVFVIDELDRCRPDYALQVLEVLKHFFAVPHVHFILGVNLSALENSVRARYGAGIDAWSYLQKFLSLTMSLPDHIDDFDRSPAVLAYFNKAADDMQIPQNLKTVFSDHLKIVSRVNHISIRDVRKILSSIALIDDTILNRGWILGYLEVAATLIVTKISRPDLHSKFVRSEISDHEIASYFGATKSQLIEIEDNEYNSSYDHQKFWRCKMWSFIRENGNIEDQKGRNGIGGLLDRFGDPRNPRGIPQHVYDTWMDVFKVVWG